MTDTDLTTTVTFADMVADYDDELGDLRDAYEQVVSVATEEYGDERPEWPDALRQQAMVYDEAAKTIQRRQHVLDQLDSEWSGDTFAVKMLSGEELIDIETQLRMEANQKGVDVEALQARRQQLSVDAATVDAPEEVPRDDEGSPVPSDAPNPLTMALHEQVERLNTAGDPDFRAEGFGEVDASVGLASSAGPTPSSNASSALDPTDETPPTPGDDS